MMDLIYLGLILLSLAMFTVTLILGSLPTYFQNQALMKLMAVYGAGNLLGVTFLILFPESMMAIGQSQLQGNQLAQGTTLKIGASFMTGFVVMILIDELVARLFKQSQSNGQ